jgi:biotin transporter BioY
VIYAVGVPWLAATYLDGDLGRATEVGLLPYVLWDVIKLTLAASAFPAAWWFVGRRPGDR